MLLCDGADNTIRWAPGERLHHLYEQRCDALVAARRQTQLAIDGTDASLTFDALDMRANQLARQLLASGLQPGDRVGLLVDKSISAYVGLLAILKMDAAFVPMDASFPLDRIAYIAGDAAMAAILTVSAFADRFAAFDACPVGYIEEIAEAAAALPMTRLTAEDTAGRTDELAYIVYTSGSTGNPKGVAVDHASICNFVRVAGEVYGITADDRVYQGMTLAFDFSVEEVWVPLCQGATLVPARSDTTLVGRDLAEFLISRHVTGLCCVPTLLATIDVELPQLRFLLVSGEACPHDLVVRWHRTGRRMLNAYGPTEATVTASWTELHPDKPVTIGQPLPTYTMMILALDGVRELPDGEIGEIGIAGVGLAVGYVGRDDMTAAAFVPDALGCPHNPSGRIYRTGDLGRITPGREIEYHGRIDTQVKVRGYRIELTEIESRLLEYPGIAQAVVRTFTCSKGGPVELAAYVTRTPSAPPIEGRDVAKYLRGRLPGYMVPAYIEEIDSIPMLPSQKADRKRLPPPAGGRVMSGSGGEAIAPRTPMEAVVAQALAVTLGLEAVSVNDHMFDDLGANSLTMAAFVTRLQAAMPAGAAVAIADAYRHPTPERLAAALEAQGSTRGATTALPPAPARVASRFQHALCGLMQYLFYVAVAFVYLVIGVEAYRWQADATDTLDLYVRSVAAVAGVSAFSVALPIAAKWLLFGRFRAECIPIWSWRYYRFWVVRQLIQSCPLVLFRGQPIFNWYLRRLGARIGRGAVISPRVSPVCADLLTVGENTVLAKDTLVLGYTAERGMIVTEPVRIGREAYVGEGSVVEIGTTICDGGQLAHVSCLPRGHLIPPGARYHGSPAVPIAPLESRFEGEHVPTLVPVPARACGTARRWLFTLAVAVLMLAVVLPAADVGVILTGRLLATWVTLDGTGDALEIATLVGGSLVAFLLSLAGGLVLIGLAARLLKALVRPDVVYPLYGPRYGLALLAGWATNSTLYNIVFGDSSFITGYLRWVGYDLGQVKQSGSNFGVYQRHDVSTLCGVGSGTLVSDGLSMINVRQSSTSFALARADIPDDTFLGNHVVYVAGAKLGRGTLLATKVMVPLHGPMREGVGLLGSPAFEIPRQTVTARTFDATTTTLEQQRRLAAKDSHNLTTMIYYLVLLWGYALLTIVFGKIVTGLHADYGVLALLLAAVMGPVLTVAYFIAVEMAGPGRLPLDVRTCTIHDAPFFDVERYWKMGETPLRQMFKGTPFRPWIYRRLGVDMGRMVFDDGCSISEKPLTHVGDHACLNDTSSLQAHTLEDGLFKSDHIRLGRGVTLGPAAYVNYGVTIGDGAIVAADSFLMKGTVVGANEVWLGNPARRG